MNNNQLPQQFEGMGNQNSAQLQQMLQQHQQQQFRQQNVSQQQQNFNPQFMPNAQGNSNPGMQQAPPSNQLPPQLQQTQQMSGQQQFMQQNQQNQRQNTGSNMLPNQLGQSQNFGGAGQESGAGQGNSNNQSLESKYASLLAQINQQNNSQPMQQNGQNIQQQSASSFPQNQQNQQSSNQTQGGNQSNDLYAQLLMQAKNGNMNAKPNESQFQPGQNATNSMSSSNNMMQQKPQGNMPQDAATMLQNLMQQQKNGQNMQLQSNQSVGQSAQSALNQLDQMKYQPQMSKNEEKHGGDQNITNAFTQSLQNLQNQRQPGNENSQASTGNRFQLPLAYQQSQKQPELQGLLNQGGQQSVNELMNRMGQQNPQQTPKQNPPVQQNFDLGQKMAELQNKGSGQENKEQISSQQTALAMELLNKHLQQQNQQPITPANQPSGQGANSSGPYNLSQANVSQFLQAISNQYQGSGNNSGGQQRSEFQNQVAGATQSLVGNQNPNFSTEQSDSQRGQLNTNQFNSTINSTAMPQNQAGNALTQQLSSIPSGLPDHFQSSQQRANPSNIPPNMSGEGNFPHMQDTRQSQNKQIDLVGQLNTQNPVQDNILANGGAQGPSMGVPTGTGGNVPKLMDYHNLSRMAEFCATKGDYEAAIDYYKRMTEILPENGPSWTALGHCYLLTEESHSAFNAYQHALYSLDDIKDPQLWYGIGILYEKFESYEHAISALIAVLKMSPNFYQKSEVLFKLGTIFAKTNQISEAITYFQNSIVASTFTIKRKIDTLLKIGLLYEVKQEYPAAQRSYEAALSLNEHNYRVYQHLAWCNFLKGNIQASLENLDKAERKLKGSTDTLYIYGRCMLELGKHREAHYYFHEAAHKAPNEAIFWASLAYYYYQEGKYKETFNNIIKATALKPELYEVWYNLGILYEKCKQPEEALIAYDRVLQIEKNQKDAQEHINMIKAPNYEQRLLENQELLSMKQPVYCLPNSLTILRKYQQINETEHDIQKRININSNEMGMDMHRQNPMNMMPQGSQGMGTNQPNTPDRMGMSQVNVGPLSSLQMPGDVNKVQNPEQNQPIMQMPLKQDFSNNQQVQNPQMTRIEQPPQIQQPNYQPQFKDQNNLNTSIQQPPQVVQPQQTQPQISELQKTQLTELRPMMSGEDNDFNKPQNAQSGMMIAPAQSKIVEPHQQPSAGRINLGQVGHSFLGTKQDESGASNSVKQDQDDKNPTQIPYVLNALQMQNPNGQNIQLNQLGQQQRQNENDQHQQMAGKNQIDDQNTLTAQEEDDDQHDDQQQNQGGVISMREVQGLDNRQPQNIAPPMQIVDPMNNQNGMDKMQQNQNTGIGLISSITTTLPSTIMQNGQQKDSQQQNNQGPDMNEQKSNNIVISKPSMYIENPSNQLGVIQMPVQLNYANQQQDKEEAHQNQQIIAPPKENNEHDNNKGDQQQDHQIGGMKVVQNLAQQNNMPPIVMKSSTIQMPLVQQPQQQQMQAPQQEFAADQQKEEQVIIPPHISENRQQEPQEVLPGQQDGGDKGQNAQDNQVQNLSQQQAQSIIEQIQNSGNQALLQQMLNQQQKPAQEAKPQSFGLVQAPPETASQPPTGLNEEQQEKFQQYMNIVQQQNWQNMNQSNWQPPSNKDNEDGNQQ